MLPPSLVDAYNSTEYRVFEPALTILIGRHHPELDQLLELHSCITWAYITASNPFSQILSDEENSHRFSQLLTELSGYPIYQGEGVGTDPNWKPEKSLLILGLSIEEARRIGLIFEQNAIVVGQKNKVAELLIVR